MCYTRGRGQGGSGVSVCIVDYVGKSVQPLVGVILGEG